MSPPIKIGIIGGSGLNNPNLLTTAQGENLVDTPFGKPSSPLEFGKIGDVPCVLLARHGRRHTIMPSLVNYRANIWALHHEGCTHIISTTLCGSLREEIEPGTIVLPNQFIDRTTKRYQTFYDGMWEAMPGICHIPMDTPFCQTTRQALGEVIEECGLSYHEPDSTILTIEGPRFSSKAESNMFRLWGADLVNMTTMPEVVLAKELGICYATIALVTDYDCWREVDDAKHVTVEQVVATFKENANKAIQVLTSAIPHIAKIDWTDIIKTNRTTADSSVLKPRK